MLAPLLAALAIPAASGAVVAGHPRLRITPAAPHPRSAVVISFRQPNIGGLLPSQRTAETLTVVGPSRRGCITGVVRQVSRLAAGTPMREVLRPGTLATGRWCEAVYRVALELTVQQTCPIGPVRHVCPQLVPVPEVVATARFRVTRAPRHA